MGAAARQGCVIPTGDDRTVLGSTERRPDVSLRYAARTPRSTWRTRLNCTLEVCRVEFGFEEFTAEVSEDGRLTAFGPHYFELDPDTREVQGVTGEPYYDFTGTCTERVPEPSSEKGSAHAADIEARLVTKISDVKGPRSIRRRQ